MRLIMRLLPSVGVPETFGGYGSSTALHFSFQFRPRVAKSGEDSLLGARPGHQPGYRVASS
eukprot:scaffold37841_cov54-Phaeocystis_antarctica.AAC.2